MRARRRSGFSLLEMMISVALFGLVIGSLGMIGVSNRRAYQAGTLSADLEAHARRAVDRIVQQMMRSGASVLIPDPAEGVGGSDVTYRQAENVTAGGVQWSDLYRFELQYEPGELDDGIDNNGNGLVDECRLVWTERDGEADERSTVLCRWVREYFQGEEATLGDENGNGLEEERGFCLERVGETLVIRLTLERNDPQGRPQTRSITTSIKLRN